MVYSGISGTRNSLAGAASPLSIPNRSICPSRFWRASVSILFNIPSTLSSMARRLDSSRSKAPALMRFSSARRFSSLPRSRLQKSYRPRYGSPARRRTTASISPRPTLFTAFRPKRMLSPSAVKPPRDTLMSGCCTVMPRRWHSVVYSMTLVVLSSTLVSRAAINSCG